MSTNFGSLVVTLVITPLVWLSAVPAKLFINVEKPTLAAGGRDSSNCLSTDKATSRGK